MHLNKTGGPWDKTLLCHYRGWKGWDDSHIDKKILSKVYFTYKELHGGHAVTHKVVTPECVES